MSGIGLRGEILEGFARMFEYPGDGTARAAQETASRLSRILPEADPPVRRFLEFLADTPRGRAEEVYTAAFDLQAACSPYVGWHLLGEGYKRRIFLARLQEIYRLHGFSCGRELPDHVAILLRFLAMGPEEQEARVIVDDGLVPAVEKMSAAFGDSENPYRDLLRALALWLAAPDGRGTDAAPAGLPGEVGSDV